jgi:YbgC/YbaW family acyl-CoA thioester hydrolase
VVSEIRYRRRVQFAETDLAGLVHFSCFFRYMEEAEHELWRQAGLSIAPRGATFGFPRVAASFEFVSPLRFEDEFDVVMRIVEMTRRTIRYECTLTCGDRTIATGSLKIACVSKRPDAPMASMDIPAEIASRLGPVSS